ncbi:MAG TPA: NADH-quinone oxidoreductase subunit H [Ktedonobacterales bacterium]|jgi:NADH-quinone oxidoreductase subunit H
MNIILRYAITILLYPGGMFALLAGWVLLWLAGSLSARWRGIRGTSLLQPARDFFKLLNKTTSLPIGAETGVRLIPLLAVVAPLLALVLLPLPGNLAADSSTTSGDLLAVLFLLLLPALAPVFLGNLLASPYGRVAAQRAVRRAALLAALLLLSALAIAAQRGSLSLALLTTPQSHPSAANIILDALAGLIFLLCLPALIPQPAWGIFQSSPELIAGPYTDLTGADLALMQLSATLQQIAAASLLASLFILPYVPGGSLAQVVVYLITLLLSSLVIGLLRWGRASYSFAR